MKIQAIFVYRLSVRCEIGGLIDPGSQIRYRLKLERDLPFVPHKSMLFYDEHDEYLAEEVHFDLSKNKFIVDLGGGLCHDEGDLADSLKYELSKGWSIDFERKRYDSDD